VKRLIKLFIFDLDGVLTSTSDEHFQAWKLLIKDEFDFEIDPSIEELTKGVSRRESLDRILDKYNLEVSSEKKEEFMFKKNKTYQKLISNYSTDNLFENVINVFNYLKEKNILIALGSASKNGQTIVKSLEIGHYLDYIVDPTHLRSKPQPDIFLSAMNHFGLSPLECIGVEDAIAGVKSINNAGMFSVGIGEKYNLHEADLIFKHISEITVGDLEKLIGD